VSSNSLLKLSLAYQLRFVLLVDRTRNTRDYQALHRAVERLSSILTELVTECNAAGHRGLVLTEDYSRFVAGYGPPPHVECPFILLKWASLTCSFAFRVMNTFCALQTFDLDLYFRLDQLQHLQGSFL